MKVCKSCNAINTNDCEYCYNCGKSDFVYQEEITCPNCGAANDKKASYCINCGNQFPKDEKTVAAAADVVVPAEHVEKDVVEREQQPIYHVETSEQKETAQCPNCGANVPIYAIYCQKCGQPVASLHQHRVVRRKVCPHCGKPNSMESHFCSYCFHTLANAEIEEMQLVHDLRPIGGEMVKQAYLADNFGKNKICANCGTLNPQNELFCVNCGYKLDVEEQKKFCPNCGAENSSGNAFCTKCQWSFDGSAPDTVKKWVCPVCKSSNDAENEYCGVCGSKKETNSGRKK